MPHLYLVDGSGYIFRAYHRLPPLTNPRGEPVGAVYGFTAMLWKLVDELRAQDHITHLAIVLDAAKTSFRNEMYADYKAHRPDPPADLVPQFPVIRDAVRAFSLPCIERVEFEADDIIASYALAAHRQGWDTTIVSSDKDLMQLVRPGPAVIDMLDTMQNKRFDTAAVVEKFGVPPGQLGELLALMGDSVDNVPGVPGVGPKTAAELIQQYGTVEGVLANLAAITKPKLRANLEGHADNARLSRELVKLHCDMPLDPPLDGLVLNEPPRAVLAAFLREQGFRTLLARVTGDAPVPAPAKPDAPQAPFDRAKYQTVTTEDALALWVGAAAQAGTVAVDLLTTDDTPVAAAIVGVALCVEPGTACYIPIGHDGALAFDAEPQQLPRDTVLAALRPLLADAAVMKVGHNLKHDIATLRLFGGELAPFEDTQLMSYALDGGRSGHALDELAGKHLGHTVFTPKEIAGTGQSRIGLAQVPIARATEYAAEMADVALRLHTLFGGRLWREGGTRVYRMVDLAVVPAIVGMELAGIKVDRAELARLSEEFALEIARLEGEIFAHAGRPFTIGSPKQLGEVLFDTLALPGGKKGKSGQYSTDVTVLESLAEKHAMPRLVLDWRQLTKLKQTYTDALQASIQPSTGRVHTCYAMAQASTGRLSSTEPNLQNIPIRTEIGRRIRDAFVAEPGHVLMAADYNQIELRLMAHIADVPELKAAYAREDDIHTLTAREVFGAGDVVDRELRARAKTVNFSIIYGISAFGLAQRLGIGRDEAGDYINRYFERFPGIRDYMGRTINEVREREYVETLFGRKIHIPSIRSKVMSERQGAERQAINAPVQGTAADIIKRAMARMPGALAAAGLVHTRMLLSVHDELVFEVADAEVARATGVIRDTMAGAAAPVVALSVPLGVEVGTGANWGAAH